MKNLLLVFYLLPTMLYCQKIVDIDLLKGAPQNAIVGDVLNLYLTDASETVTIADNGVVNDGHSIISIPGFPSITFSNIETINIFCTGGNDVVNVLALDGLLPVTFVLNVYGEDGDDQLVVNHDPSIIFPINYFGGNQVQTDVMQIVGTTSNKVEHSFSNANDGMVIIDNTRTITYTGLEPIADNLSASNRYFTFLGGSEIINIGDNLAANDNISRISSTLGELVDFIHPSSSLTIEAGNGNDIVNFSLLDDMFGLSELFIDGGPDTDELIIDAQGATYSDDGSTISLVGYYDVHYSNFENVTLINAIPIPTLSQWGVIVLGLITLIFGVVFIIDMKPGHIRG